VVRAHDDQLALTLNTGNYPTLEAFLLNMLDEVCETEPSNATILLPTPDMTIESRLERCSGCADYIERTRAIEFHRSAQPPTRKSRRSRTAMRGPRPSRRCWRRRRGPR
jgi:hypothetical protein